MMIKKYIQILLSFLAIAVLGSCKVNNGDIGLLYGTWVVERVTVDGNVYDGWTEEGAYDTFFSFQNNICMINRVETAHHESQSYYCTWVWQDDNETRIALDFDNGDDRYERPGLGIYSPPLWLLLDTPGVYVFDIAWDDDKHTRWSTVNTQGQRIEYSMKKTW